MDTAGSFDTSEVTVEAADEVAAGAADAVVDEEGAAAVAAALEVAGVLVEPAAIAGVDAALAAASSPDVCARVGKGWGTARQPDVGAVAGWPRHTSGVGAGASGRPRHGAAVGAGVVGGAAVPSRLPRLAIAAG